MANSDPFAIYKLPVGMTEGVEIPLPGTPAVFKVVLPSTSNEEFTLAVISGMNAKVNDEGSYNLEPIAFNAARKKVFFETCVLSATGLPDGMDVQTFLSTYTLAGKALFEEAQTLASTADDEVQEALGKLQSSRNGSYSGGAKRTNTKPLKKAESKSEHAAPN